MMESPFVPIPGQSFSCQQDWVNRASRVLTAHPEYRNTEHNGPEKGWRGSHFTALCFDQLGRRCRCGADFRIAEEDDAYPIWWIWPDQIVNAILGAAGAKQQAPDSLRDSIKAVLAGIRKKSVDDAADLLNDIGDDLAESPSEDCINGAILDGIRWGYETAVSVEMGGGAMLRISLPGGVGITHQWGSESTARAQIDAALDAIAVTRDAEKQRDGALNGAPR